MCKQEEVFSEPIKFYWHVQWHAEEYRPSRLAFGKKANNKGTLFSKSFVQISSLFDFSSISSSKLLFGLWLAEVENLNLNPELWLAARNLEEKMDEKLDNVDIWMNLLEIKLPLINQNVRDNARWILIIFAKF